MLTLTLLRHAKSSWNHPDLTDFDRPLNDRGKRDAPVMGSYLADHDLVPDLILCSTAKRARETLSLASDGWRGTPKTEFQDDLYLADSDTMLTKLRSVTAGPRQVMMIGHNPGIHAFACGLIKTGDSEMRLALSAKYPTAAITVVEFDANNWADVETATGHLALFTSPKRLAAS